MSNHREPRGFFGRHKGHALKPHQAGLFKTLLPQLALDLDAPAPADARSLFPAVNDMRLEIGFGGAEHLIAQAKAHPRTGFIASDGYLNAIGKALAGIETHSLKNVRLYHGDALNLLGWLPAASLSRIDLLYPDPWPKRRHWKRRFVGDETVRQFARLLKSGGEFRYASDIDGYVAWTLAHMQRAPDFEWTAERPEDWRNPWPDFAGTRYEAKAKREGRVPCYLTFRRK